MTNPCDLSLPALRRMPAPSPLPTLQLPRRGLGERLAAWLAARLQRPALRPLPTTRPAARVLVLRRAA